MQKDTFIAQLHIINLSDCFHFDFVYSFELNIDAANHFREVDFGQSSLDGQHCCFLYRNSLVESVVKIDCVLALIGYVPLCPQEDSTLYPELCLEMH